MSSWTAGFRMLPIHSTRRHRSYTLPISPIYEINEKELSSTGRMTQSQTRPIHHRRVAPPPSAATIAMWERGLELPHAVSARLSAECTDASKTGKWSTIRASHPAVTSPTDSHWTDNSSIYSMESVHSRDSIGTTISQIVDMYTDLINKIPISWEDVPAHVEILQPKAYRDTVAPLLQRRFSAETRPPSGPPMSDIPSSPKYASQAPTAFQEFTRNLKQRRADLVSPMTMTSSDISGVSAVDILSEPLPTTFKARPLSFTTGERDQLTDISACRSVSPVLDKDEAVAEEFVALNRPAFTDTQNLDQAVLNIQDLNSKESDSGTCKSVIVEKPPQLTATDMQEPNQLLDLQVESDRYYTQHSAAQLSSSKSVARPAGGENIKAKIKKKIGRKRDTKEEAEITTLFAQRYPYVTNEPLAVKEFSSQQKMPQLMAGTSGSAQASSSTKTASTYLASHSRQKITHAAIPLTAYQKYGPQAWLDETKQKRKAGRRRSSTATQGQLMQSQLSQAPNETTLGPQHRRTTSSKTDAPFNGDISPSKKYSLVNALQGAKDSLVGSLADKRREKLKEGINVVGPAQVIIAEVSQKQQATTTARI